MNHRSEGPERCPQRNSRCLRAPCLPLGRRRLNICTYLEFTLIIACRRIRRRHLPPRHLPPRHLLPRLRRSSTRIVWGSVRKFSLTRRCIHFSHPNDGSSSRLEFCHRWATMQQKLESLVVKICKGAAVARLPGLLFSAVSAVTEVLNLCNPAGALSPPEAFRVSCRFRDRLLHTKTLTWWRNLSQSKIKKSSGQ